MSTTATRALVAAFAIAVPLASCSPRTAPDAASEAPAEIAINPTTSSADDQNLAATSPTDASSPAEIDVRQRCLDASRTLERRWDEEDFDDPYEEPELSEEELEQTMSAAQPHEDGVAAPGERPELTAMAPFDPEQIPIPQLDRFVESCFEQGVLSDQDDEGQDDEGEWCEELAALPVEEVREFAAEEGDDVVRAEFEECGVPNPLES